MKNNEDIVMGLYLSKFDKSAYKRLGQKNQTEAFKFLSYNTDYKWRSIRNRRDQYDTYYKGNGRTGWKKSPEKSIKIKEKYGNLTEEDFYKQLVEPILNRKNVSSIAEKIKVEIPIENLSVIEGEVTERTVLSYKRNQSIVKKRKEIDDYRCQACGFKFKELIVECHHLKPLFMHSEYKAFHDALITLCPTCHRVAHHLIQEGLDNYEDSKVLVGAINKALL